MNYLWKKYRLEKSSTEEYPTKKNAGSKSDGKKSRKKILHNQKTRGGPEGEAPKGGGEAPEWKTLVAFKVFCSKFGTPEYPHYKKYANTKK